MFGEPLAAALSKYSSNRRSGPVIVKSGLRSEPLRLLRHALTGRNRFLLAPHAGLFEMLAFLDLGQDAGLLARFLEAAEGLLETFVVTYTGYCHEISPALRRHNV
jgi:hypothetical protein